LKRALFKAPFLPVTELAGLTTTEGRSSTRALFHQSLIFEGVERAAASQLPGIKPEETSKKD
jgi:hypothetical protein